MPFTLATWNINSVRLREPIVLKLLAEHGPDVLCLQECKSPVDKIPTAAFIENGVTVHNFYVPAGGDVPDREVNEKFGQKLDYLADMRDWFHGDKPEKSILVGDLNIAPREDDVWDHKKLLKVVSHTPIEVEKLAETQDAGGFVDVTRQDIPQGNLYSWWSYRAKDWDAADKGRRLDHVWATPDISGAAHSSRVLRDARGWEKPSDHAPVFATFDL